MVYVCAMISTMRGMCDGRIVISAATTFPFSTQTFYTAHGDNALFIARTFYKTTAVLRYFDASGRRQTALVPGQPGQLASVAMNRGLFEGALKELLLEGSEHRVEIYEGSGVSWRLTKCGKVALMFP